MKDSDIKLHDEVYRLNASYKSNPEYSFEKDILEKGNVVKIHEHSYERGEYYTFIVYWSSGEETGENHVNNRLETITYLHQSLTMKNDGLFKELSKNNELLEAIGNINNE